MNQTKVARMHPGTFRSSLIPFTDQILDWWYDDLLTAAEIQRRLKAEGLDVARTTVMRFIKVREQRASKRKRPSALRKKNTISAEHPVIPPPSQTQSLRLGTAALPASEATKNIVPAQGARNHRLGAGPVEPRTVSFVRSRTEFSPEPSLSRRRISSIALRAISGKS